MTITDGVITKVEPTKDNPGWVIYFNDNKHFLRLKAKYKAQPSVGDNIKIYGFPKTRGLEINGKVIFMHDSERAWHYYSALSKSVNHCKEIEKIISNMPKKTKVEA
jgi:hypothetical protein